MFQFRPVILVKINSFFSSKYSGFLTLGNFTAVERPYFTRNPDELQGERISTSLIKSTRGLGFTIIGGDDAEEEFLQIKSVVPQGPAWQDGKLQMGQCILIVFYLSSDFCPK
jgi:PDZ domain